MSVTAVLGVLASPVTNLVGKWIERRAVKDGLKSKAVMAKQSDSTNITLTDAEWETVNSQNADGTWKDEYVTIIITAPLVGILGGAVTLAFTGDARLLDGTIAGLTALQALDIDMSFLMNAVVLSAIGLKMWRKG